MNQRAVMRNTLSTRCRLFISQPENYTTAMGVYNQTATSQLHLISLHLLYASVGTEACQEMASYYMHTFFSFSLVKSEQICYL